MARHLLRASTVLSSPKPSTQGQPGTNGFWRREWYRLPGTYTWTAPKSGFVKIQALGSGAGAKRAYAGPAGGFGEKTLFVAAGQTLTIVIGSGSLGSSQLELSVSQGGTTSISGAPVGGTPLTILGARNPSVSSTVSVNISEQVGGIATGPWDLSYPGGVGTTTSNAGGPSSGSPFGPGSNGAVAGGGASGWGGQARNGASSTHYAGNGSAAPGLLSRTAPFPFWDMRDVDSPAGNGAIAGQTSNAGPGAGGGAGPGNVDGGGGVSAFGGGTGHSSGFSADLTGATGGNGAGGGSTNSNSSGVWTGGKGGDGMVLLFWDEVA